MGSNIDVHFFLNVYQRLLLLAQTYIKNVDSKNIDRTIYYK